MSKDNVIRDFEKIPPERRGDACLTSIPVRVVVVAVALVALVWRSR